MWQLIVRINLFDCGFWHLIWAVATPMAAFYKSNNQQLIPHCLLFINVKFRRCDRDFWIYKYKYSTLFVNF